MAYQNFDQRVHEVVADIAYLAGHLHGKGQWESSADSRELMANIVEWGEHFERAFIQSPHENHYTEMIDAYGLMRLKGDHASAEAFLETMRAGQIPILPASDQIASESSQIVNSVAVKHWNAYECDGTLMTHQLDIDDQRQSNGQAYLTLGCLEGELDDFLNVVIQVDTYPLNGIDTVPCARISIGSDLLEVVLYQVGSKLLLVPDTLTHIRPEAIAIDGQSVNAIWVS